MSNQESPSKLVVQKVKDALKSLGHDISTGHVYDALSKAAGHKNWHSAKVSGVDFGKMLTEHPLAKEGQPTSITRAMFLSELKRQIDSIDRHSDPNEKIQPLVLMGLGSKFNLISKEEGHSFREEIQNAGKVFVHVTRGKYVGDFGYIHFLDQDVWETKNKVRVELCMNSSTSLLSPDSLSQASAAQYRKWKDDFHTALAGAKIKNDTRFKPYRKLTDEEREKVKAQLRENWPDDSTDGTWVEVIGGRHKGMIGSWDDDDDNGAIIYPFDENGLMLMSGYSVVPYKHLVSIKTGKPVGNEDVQDEEETLTFGPVKVVKGEYKGQEGYYDNDEGPNKAVVYLGGAPFIDKSSFYVEMPHHYLEPIAEWEPLTRLEMTNPEIVEKGKLVIRREGGSDV